MKREEFIRWAESKGFKDERGYGRYSKEFTITNPATGETKQQKRCYKVSNVAVRYESQIEIPSTEYSKSTKEWVRIGSNYLKYLSIKEEGKLAGLKR
ncbi:MAG: hypothetical protein ABIC57_01405 [bacterium]